ncbi:MAG: DUF4116 domain-containing protein [Bacilli bacterium]|nr:DUF4116 domain-containing protein [Bacilli bacterium]
MNYNDDLSEFRRLHNEMVNQPEDRELEAAADLIIRRHYNDRDFMLEAIKTDPNVVDQLDSGLKSDPSFIAEIVRNNPDFNWNDYGIDTSLAEESRLEGLLDKASTIPTDSAINTLNNNNTQGEQSMDDIIREQTEAMYDTRDEMIQDYLNQNQAQPEVSNTVEAPVAAPVEPTPVPEEVKVQDVDNTDTADLSASITDFTSYLKDGIGKIEEINENLNQVVFPETHLENYFSLEDYFKAEKNLPFGDKNFADLTNEEKSNLTFLYRRDMENDRNKIISMIKDKYNNQKNSFVNAISSKTKQVSRLVENFVHEMTSKKESAEMKLKWALQDFEELENERKTPTTSFERAQEILDLERKLQKEIDSYRSSISNYAGLIGLGKSYGELAADISARVADGKLELNDQLKELDSIYETLQNPDKVKEFAETSRAKVGEPEPVVETPVVEEPIPEPEVKEEPVKEEEPEKAEEPEAKEEDKEEDKEETKEPVKEEKVEPKKEEEDNRVFTPEAPGINLDPRKVTRPEAKAVIASRRSFNRTAMTVPVAIGLGLALISTSPVSTLTVPLGLAFGAMAGGNAILTKALHDKLQEYFLKRKLDQLAANYDAEVVYDYENHEAHFGFYDEKEDKYKIIKDYSDLEKRLERILKEEGSLAPNFEAAELGNKYAAQFKKLSRGGDLMSSDIESILTPLFDRVGGVTPAVPIATQIIEPAIEQGRKFFGKKKEQFLNLISNKEKYNLNEEQIERIEKDAELADQVVNRGVFKGSNVVRKASELKDKLMNSRFVADLRNRNDEEFFEDEFEEKLENQRPEEDKQIVEEQNIDEEFAPEVPIEEAPVEEAPVVETPVQVIEEDRQKEIGDSLYEDDLAKESAELQNDEVIDVEKTNTYDPKVSYDEYNRWIDSLRNSESELDELHVRIGLDENLSEAEKQALQSKIEFMVSPTKVEDTGRSL